ncbi:MAG: DUF4255 domain-containing protein [bacterium]|nr:DUF4255 domain-containing protein [bacterium]
MSEYTVLQDIGTSLRHLMETNIDASIVAPANIELESPNNAGDETVRRLSLFLFQIAENPHLINREMQSVNHTTLKPPPITVDLYYLITPFAQSRSEEHRILGRVMQIFYDNAILRAPILRGDLEGGSHEFHVTLHSPPFEEVLQLWQSFTDRSFSLSVCYKVTPVEIDSTREISAKRVLEKRNQYYQKSVQKVT